MDHVVKTLKVDLQKSARTPEEILQNRFVGGNALVVSAGPSAVYWRDLYDVLPKPLLLVCIKQAIELEGASDLCNLHFCNTWNLKNYRYDRSRLLRLFSSAPGDPPSLQSWDIRFEIHRGAGGLEASLAAIEAFEDWTLERRGSLRPWGPGMMYESVLFTLLHMGVSSISTVGWDIADPKGSNSHFYDLEEAAHSQNFRVRQIRKIRRLTSISKGACIKRVWQYKTGRKYNLAGMMSGEAELISKSLPALSEWLESRSVSLSCYTDSAWFPSSLAKDPTSFLSTLE
ncbi:MAG: hypothetical protein NXH81_15315 [Halieaceae bacterium]|uniref:hypothetical protein n=1 Tax=Haliea alexandrii TaxID=2448162 RepID=UPI0013050410|nr:hypothetical protein [Haliea alexandrii]MCR9186767.1 hypothetical protein [Halieaceae bacterium]